MNAKNPNRGGGASVVALPQARPIAAAMIVAEHDRLARALMGAIDLLDEVQKGTVPGRVNVPNVRRATGKILRESLAARTAALAVLTAEDGT